MQRVHITYYLVLIKILWSSSGCKNVQKSNRFLKSRLSVILTNMESEIRFPLHLEITPMFGWSNPEAQSATWMSTIQGSRTFSRKPRRSRFWRYARNSCRTTDYPIEISMQSIWWPHSCFWKKSGKTSLQMSTATNAICVIMSQNLLENWYVMETAVTEKQMEQFIGDQYYIKNRNLRSWSKEEIPSLSEIGSIISGREAARHDFGIARILAAVYCIFELFKDTREKLDRTRVDGSCRYTLQVETILISPRMLIQFEVNLGGRTHCKVKKKPRGTRNCVLHTLDPWRNDIEEQCCGEMSKPRKVHYKIEWKHTQDAVYWTHLARTQEKGLTPRQTQSHASIAHKTVPPDWIESDISERWDDFISTTLYTVASSKKNSQICLESAAAATAAGWFWEASENWSGRGTKVKTTVLRKMRRTATITMLWERVTRFKSIFEFMECHKTSSTKTRSGKPK